MKRNKLLAALLMLAPLLSACSAAAASEPHNVQTAAVSGNGAVTSKEGMTFPLGTEVPFNGTGYLATMISNEEVYNFPQTNHVTFEPDVINDWHTHEGGQILIVTDGIGYHRIESQPVEVLQRRILGGGKRNHVRLWRRAVWR